MDTLMVDDSVDNTPTSYTKGPGKGDGISLVDSEEVKIMGYSEQASCEKTLDQVELDDIE